MAISPTYEPLAAIREVTDYLSPELVDARRETERRLRAARTLWSTVERAITSANDIDSAFGSNFSAPDGVTLLLAPDAELVGMAAIPYHSLLPSQMAEPLRQPDILRGGQALLLRDIQVTIDREGATVSLLSDLDEQGRQQLVEGGLELLDVLTVDFDPRFLPPATIEAIGRQNLPVIAGSLATGQATQG